VSFIQFNKRRINTNNIAFYFPIEKNHLNKISYGIEFIYHKNTSEGSRDIQIYLSKEERDEILKKLDELINNTKI